MTKKRILFVGEASFLNTGFSTIYRELLPRLAATDKYDIAEIGCYARTDDPRVQEFIKGRWKFWGNMPTSQEEAMIYNRNSEHPRDKGQNINQFGANIFDQVVAEFKPDFCVMLRDNWMDSFILRSCFRPWMKVMWMPTVDSPQQAEEWINDYEQCNLVMAYSDFGVHTLKSQSSKIKLFPKPMRPGVDLEVFKPLNKEVVREKFNLNKNIPIIGIVQRNQSRKMILDVIDAFAMMKNKNKDNKAAQESVLLLHTAWPDNLHSFDYPRHIRRVNSNKWMKNYCPSIMNSILQTLICHNCGEASLCHAVNLSNQPIRSANIKGKQISGIFMPCVYCGQQTATCPNTSLGFSREQLSEVYNLMNVFVQCSIAEGCAVPVQESKSCGIPAIVTDHSATTEKGRFPSEYVHFKDLNITEDNYTIHHGGITHDVCGYRHEPETGCLRAVPDVKDLSEKMFLMISNKELQSKMSTEARKCAEQNYDWNVLWKQWEYVIDNIKPLDRSQTWDSPIAEVEDIKPLSIPDNLSDEQYIEWLYLNVLKYPNVDFDGARMWLQNLQQGVTREQLMQQFVGIGNQQSDASKTRDRIRQEVNGLKVNNNNRHGQEFV